MLPIAVAVLSVTATAHDRKTPKAARQRSRLLRNDTHRNRLGVGVIAGMQRSPRGFVVIEDFELLTLLHDAPVERLRGADIVWIKLGERADLIYRDANRSLEHIPRDALTAGRSCQ